MKYILMILFLTFTTVAQAQVKLLTYNELQNRIANGNDTTYVVNFWATWCGPCVEELPYFEKLNATKFRSPIKVILMSLDYKSKLQSAVIPFVKKQSLKSEVYVVNTPNQQAFIDEVNKDWSGAIPATLVVNSKSKAKSFYEKEFTYEELVKLIENLNNK